jgi:dihydropteroate synthase
MRTDGLLRARAWSGPGFSFDLSARAVVMGIVNVTPDSFSGDGRGAEAAIAHALAQVDAGADVLDVGGESTRPGAERVDSAEEIRRVVPVIAAVRARTKVPISIDTVKADVAREALDAGATIVNDTSGLRFDPAMAPLCARRGAAVVVMHMRGEPRTMQVDPRYDDLVGEVRAALAESVAAAEAAGIPRARIAVDPGIGFGKTFDHNLTLIARLGELRDLGCAVLVGPSRKAFLGALLGGAPPGERTWGTAAAVAAAIVLGADVVRVHDVAEMARVARVASAIRGAGEGR